MHTYECIPHHSDFITDDIAIMIAMNVFWNILYAQISTDLILCTGRKKGTTNRREQTKWISRNMKSKENPKSKW